MIKAIKNAIIVLLSLALLLTWIEIYHLFFYYKMKGKPFRKTLINNPYECKEVDRQNYKQILDDLFDTPHITRVWPKLEDACSLPMFHIMYMNESTFNYYDVKTYAHELTHIKYQTYNECFTCYTCIITLYESGNEFLKFIAINYANDITCYYDEQDDGNCGYYLIEYFKEKEKIKIF